MEKLLKQIEAKYGKDFRLTFETDTQSFITGVVQMLYPHLRAEDSEFEKAVETLNQIKERLFGSGTSSERDELTNAENEIRLTHAMEAFTLGVTIGKNL